MTRFLSFVVCAWLVGCGGGGASAELLCTNNDGLVVVNDNYTCDEYCDQGAELLTQALSGCGGDAECDCTFAQGEDCVVELEGRECAL